VGYELFQQSLLHRQSEIGVIQGRKSGTFLLTYSDDSRGGAVLRACICRSGRDRKRESLLRRIKMLPIPFASNIALRLSILQTHASSNRAACRFSSFETEQTLHRCPTSEVTVPVRYVVSKGIQYVINV
jgi:hypothetical protein